MLVLFFLFVLSRAPSVSKSSLYLKQLTAKGLRVRQKLTGDGNCFFRAFSFALYGNEDRHQDVRDRLANYVSNLPEDEWVAHRNRTLPEHGGQSKASYAEHIRQSGSAWNGSRWGATPGYHVIG